MVWCLARSMMTLELPRGSSRGAGLGADLPQAYELLTDFSRQRQDC